MELRTVDFPFIPDYAENKIFSFEHFLQKDIFTNHRWYLKQIQEKN